MKFRLALFTAIISVACCGVFAQEQSTSAPAVTPPVPAYHISAPAKGETLPPVLTQEQLTALGFTEPARLESYKAAAKVPDLFYQMPCYCYCDRGHGHTSLHSCFESAHGANCGTCMAEALYTYQMSKKGWTAKKIRDGILHGDYKSVDLLHPEPAL